MGLFKKVKQVQKHIEHGKYGYSDTEEHEEYGVTDSLFGHVPYKSEPLCPKCHTPQRKKWGAWVCQNKGCKWYGM